MDKPICSIDGCDKLARIVGLCGMHDQRKRRGQDMTAPPKKIFGVDRPYCAVPRCGRKADSNLPNAVCANHRRRMERSGSYIATRMANGWRATCTVAECSLPHKAVGLCNNHYLRSFKYGLSCIQLDMIERQAKCDLCGVPTPGPSLHIDHDHTCCPGGDTCGQCLRGAICAGCNLGLGAFRDDIDRLIAATAYLAGSRTPD